MLGEIQKQKIKVTIISISLQINFQKNYLNTLKWIVYDVRETETETETERERERETETETEQREGNIFARASFLIKSYASVDKFMGLSKEKTLQVFVL